MARFDLNIEGVNNYARLLDKRAEKVTGRTFQLLGRAMVVSPDVMPVDTGFLLANMKIAKNGTVTGDRYKRPKGYKAGGIRARKLNQINRLAKTLEPGDNVTVEFQAEYSYYVHEGIYGKGRGTAYKFVTRPIRKFKSFVRQALSEARGG